MKLTSSEDPVPSDATDKDVSRKLSGGSKPDASTRSSMFCDFYEFFKKDFYTLNKYIYYIFKKMTVYKLLFFGVYSLFRSKNINPAIFCSVHSIIPDDPIANWALGAFVKRTKITASEMKQYVNLPRMADHEIRNWEISRIASGWMRSLLQHEPLVPEQGPKRIAVFSAYHAVTTLYLALAMVLVRKGHIVDLVLIARGCHDASPHKSWERDLVENELRLLQATLKIEGFQIHLLEDCSKSEVSNTVECVVQRQSLEDMQQLVHNPLPDLKKREVRRIHKFRRKMNSDFAARFTTFARQHKYDHWLVDSGAWAEYGVAFSILEELGIDRYCPACKVEKGYVVISKNRKFAAIDTSTAWELEKTIKRDEAQINRVVDEMRSREDPEFYEENTHFPFQRSPKLSSKVLFEKLGLNEGKPLVLMLPNIDWDTSVLTEHAHRAFPSMRAWVFETIRFYAEKPEYQLVVRAHPGEYYSGSRERISDLIHREFSELPNNVIILDSDTDVNTYALMNSSDLVLAYTSDVGWEAVIRGVPAICCGRAHFSEFGFVHAPNTQREYFERLQLFQDFPDRIRVTEAQRENAVIYADLYCNIMPKPFPWSHYKVFETLSEIPLEYVLSNAGLEQYRDTLELLAGEVSVPPGIVGRLTDTEVDKNLEGNL